MWWCFYLPAIFLQHSNFLLSCTVTHALGVLAFTREAQKHCSLFFIFFLAFNRAVIGARLPLTVISSLSVGDLAAMRTAHLFPSSNTVLSTPNRGRAGVTPMPPSLTLKLRSTSRSRRETSIRRKKWFRMSRCMTWMWPMQGLRLVLGTFFVFSLMEHAGKGRFY